MRTVLRGEVINGENRRRFVMDPTVTKFWESLETGTPRGLQKYFYDRITHFFPRSSGPSLPRRNRASATINFSKTLSPITQKLLSKPHQKKLGSRKSSKKLWYKFGMNRFIVECAA